MSKLENGPRFGQGYLFWKNWGHAQSFGKLERHLRNYYNAEIKRTKLEKITHVLEIGFGNGSFLTYAKSRNWIIVGTELNEGLVTQAASLGFDARNAASLSSIGEDQFDLIVAFDVLEHIAQGEMTEFLLVIKKALRVGGVFLARFPNGDSPFGLALQNGDPTHITSMGTGKIAYFASSCGLSLQFVGGHAEPILRYSIKHTVLCLVTVPIRKIVQAITLAIFYPNIKSTFFSSNLIVCLQKP